jgi:transcriptional antiterminator NusG
MEEEKQKSEETSSEAQESKAEEPEVKQEAENKPEEKSPEESQETPEKKKEEEKPEEIAEGASPAEEKVEEAAPQEPKIEEEKPVEEVKPVEEKAEAEVEEVREEAKEAKAKALGERKWYVIQALTGQEDRVKQAIELTIASKGLKDKVFQVLVPTEETVEIKGGKRIEKVKKMFPGYVFLEMILDEESWYLIRQTPGVARFIGTKIKPTPVSDKEMQRVLKQLGKEERLEITFEKGEVVRVISGPFRGYTGSVDEVNAEKGKLKVLINIFGRDTPVEVNFEHAQKIV